ncbi:MAG TPA: hypothetical protein H9992_06535 [Candidatus Prevotella intestinigallinarum]|jgi:hypothetical protein|nr:hypothetical protein [Candidatus Prevotella intestinigallinarum]
MKEEKKEKYESPRTEKTQVNLESGFMTASIFEDVNNQDDGVSIEGHEVGNTGDYTNIGWDFQDDQINTTNSFN